MKPLKFSLIQLSIIAIMLFLITDFYRTLNPMDFVSNSSIFQSIKAFLATVLFTIFGIITFSSTLLLQNDKETILEKINKEDKFFISPVYIFLYLYVLNLGINAFTLVTKNSEMITTMNNAFFPYLNMVFGLISIFLLRKNFIGKQTLKIVSSIINSNKN